LTYSAQRRVRNTDGDRSSAHDERAHRASLGVALPTYGCAGAAALTSLPATSSILSIVTFSFPRGSGTLLAPTRAGARTRVRRDSMLKKFALIAALLLVIAPTSARADWLFTPSIGVGVGGATLSTDKLTSGPPRGVGRAGI